MADSSRDEIAKLEALYANNPEGRVFTHLAEALRRAGDLERARTILETGLLKHAAYASAHVVLGRVLMGLHQVEEAAEAFRRVLGLDPHNLVALRSLGDIARAAGRNAEALSYFEELRHQDPNNEEIGEIIAELSASAGAFADAPSQHEGQEEFASRFDSEEAADAISALDPEGAPESTPPEESVAEAMEEAAATAEAAAPEAIPSEAAPPEAFYEPDPFDREPAVQESDPAAYGDVSSDIDLDWVPSVDQEDEEGLPGDLGSYAALATPADIPDVPTFGVPDSDEIDLGAGEFVEPSAGPDYEEVTFEPLPEAEPEVIADAFDDVSFGTEEPSYESEPEADLSFLDAAPEAEPEPASATAGDSELGFDDIAPEPAFEAYAADDIDDAPAFEPPLHDEPFAGVAEPAAESDAEAPELVTETIAELYRSQGLHERAAEIYSTLLKQRPDDATLEAKLREVEALARGEVPTTDDVFDAEPESAAPGWEESLSRDGEPGLVAAGAESNEPELPDPAEAWLAGAMGSADSPPTPYAWTEQAVDQNDDAPPITDYFRSLLSWKPTARGAVAAPMPDAPVESPVEFDEVVLDTPANAPDDSDMYATASPAMDDDIVFDDLPSDHDDGGTLLLEETAPEPPPPLTAATVVDAEPLPWEEDEPVAQAAPVPAPMAEPVPAPFEPGTATNSEDAFDEWFGDPAPAANAPEPAQDITASDNGAGAESEGSGEGDDDDDLEMFRSWLQSLKK